MNEPVLPRETLIFSDVGETELLISDYPWLVAARITAQGGRGGCSADGHPGEPGETASQVFVAGDLPARMTARIGKGGRGTGGGQPGEDGYVIVELYDRELPQD